MSIARIMRIDAHGVGGPPPPRPMMMMRQEAAAAGDAASAPPIEAGNLQVRAQVTLTAILK
jgi:uncharacterized protein YggE